jgi:2-oxo-4-hydroxy-4-carboxy-5-ureidoimidazoline decarboxylase
MTLEQLNNLEPSALTEALTKCCGSSSWVKQVSELFPFSDKEDLMDIAEDVWYQCNTEDFMEAFKHHPKIGDTKSLKEKFASTSTWASGEQSGVNQATDEVIEALTKGNSDYENKFGYIFIVCATGKSAEEMLDLLNKRLINSPEDEIMIAMEEQNKITKIRLEKLLA